MKLTNLRIMHMDTPLGIDTEPYFSWIIESDDQNVVQTAFRLQVSDENGESIWDTQKVESDKSAYISYKGKALRSCTRYYWTVMVWDNKGNYAEENSWFETAFLSKNEWKAEWAESALPMQKRKAGFGKQPPATMFRKQFFLNGDLIKKARLYATCHGVYRLTVNGVRPDDRELAPEYSSYNKYLCYQTYDLTELLRIGCNVIGMYVGDGWYCGPKTMMDKKKQKRHAVLFQLEVEYCDGTKETICSDESVSASYGPICFSDLFSGEKYDANLEIDGWDSQAQVSGQWKKVKIQKYGYENLSAQIGEPVRGVAELPVKNYYISSKGEHIIDFGQVIAGRVRMNLNLPKGTIVTVEHFEVTDKEGNYFNNIASEAGVGDGCEQKIVYVSNGKKMVYEPFFTFQGFRYVRVTGVDYINEADFTAIALSSDKRNVGSFVCSDTRLNQLYSNIRWSQRSNMISIPTDCPQREKAGWTGDICVYATTSLLNEDTTAFLTRWLQSVSCDQQENGATPIVVPFNATYQNISILLKILGRNKGGVTSSGWGDATVIVPYSMYKVTGNTEILKQQYDSMKKWCDYIINSAKNRGNKYISEDVDQCIWNTGFHFGDWLIPSKSKNGYNGNVLEAAKMTSAFTAPVYGYYSISSMAEIAYVLGMEEDHKYYTDVADKMKNAIQIGVINKDGNVPVELMGTYVMLLYFDLVPEKFKDIFTDKLVRMIKENNGCLDTGFLGTPLLLDSLCKCGHADEAYKLLYQENAPSWLYEVKNGATTIWESWYAFGEDGTPMHMSLNHYAFGCVADWMFRTINGINFEKPGFKHITICPILDHNLTFAERTYQSTYGTIVSNWKKKDDVFELSVEIPCNTTATVVLPNGSKKEVGSGKYQFEINYI